jgi:hypothetical protein
MAVFTGSTAIASTAAGPAAALVASTEAATVRRDTERKGRMGNPRTPATCWPRRAAVSRLALFLVVEQRACPPRRRNVRVIPVRKGVSASYSARRADFSARQSDRGDLSQMIHGVDRVPVRGMVTATFVRRAAPSVSACRTS